MAALPYMQLYVADYLADTMHLTTEEHGAYLLLIMNYWQTGKPLPVNRLQSIAKLSSARWTSVERALNEYFNEVDGEWHHDRVDMELGKVRAKSAQASRAGKASAAARSTGQQKQAPRTDVASPLNHTDTEADTDTEHKKKRSRFTKPEIPNLITVFEEKGSTKTEAQKFFDFYESKNWMVGKNKMANWKSAAAGWVNRNKQNHRSSSTPDISELEL